MSCIFNLIISNTNQDRIVTIDPWRTLAQLEIRESQRPADSTSGRRTIIGPCESLLLRARACLDGRKAACAAGRDSCSQPLISRKWLKMICAQINPSLVNIFPFLVFYEAPTRERDPMNGRLWWPPPLLPADRILIYSNVWNIYYGRKKPLESILFKASLFYTLIPISFYSKNNAIVLFSLNFVKS